VTILASQGSHDVAVSAARGLGTDQRNIATLATVAKQAIDTLNEVMAIERDVAQQDRDSEAKLVEIRDCLAFGMQGVQRRALCRQPIGCPHSALPGRGTPLTHGGWGSPPARMPAP